jgi:hypothetical protein
LKRDRGWVYRKLVGVGGGGKRIQEAVDHVLGWV